MTKTAAIKQAIAESSMYYLGGQYVVSYYSPQYSCNTELSPRTHASARQALADHRVARALELMGVPPEDADYYSSAYASTPSGTVAQRVTAALAMIKHSEPSLLTA